MSTRTAKLIENFLKNNDSAFDFIDEDATIDVIESGQQEMEELEYIFQQYRHPRIFHMQIFQHYQRLILKEMGSMSLDPMHNVYLACERQPYISEARKDFLRMFTVFQRSKHVLTYGEMHHEDQVAPIYRTIGKHCFYAYSAAHDS